jgi:hypothetical protein
MIRPASKHPPTSRLPFPSVFHKHEASSLSLREGTVKYLIISCLIGYLPLLSGCSPTLRPTITVKVSSANVLTISGKGFSNTTPCAHLAILSPQTVSIGDASCVGGSFPEINWSPTYVPGCQPSGSTKAAVSAADLETGTPTFATASILWAKNCAFVGTCGKIGLRACPSASYACYVDGGVDPATGACVECGTEGKPLCSNSPGCSPGFYPNRAGSGTVCTKKCGGVNQSPCITDGSSQGVTSVYTCYHSAFSYTDCVCVADTQANACQEINSGGTGVCQGSVYIPAGCK